ncbi:MAG: hypothetical protein LC792_00910 [Actinobacteria bacterium]|nr:hypothetical protein [Actinomycetota bacterium]
MGTASWTPAAALRAARALIADPAHWCQHEWALNENGEPVDPESRLAVRWCAWSAVIRVKFYAGHLWLAWAASPSSPSAVNDYDGHAAVLEMYDRAIELAEAEAT